MHADVSVGMWMLVFNSTFFEDRRLCNPRCDRSAIAVLSAACQGLCHSPSDMRALHAEPSCTDPHTPGWANVTFSAEGDKDRSLGVRQNPQEAAHTHEAVTTGAKWRDDVLWKLPSAPWRGHTIFGLMQERIDVPGADWF
jgi:hypothetical protein